MSKPCSNCSDGCVISRWCEGCDMDLCVLCYEEHNSIHFETSEDHTCQCDECFESPEHQESLS